MLDENQVPITRPQAESDGLESDHEIESETDTESNEYQEQVQQACEAFQASIDDADLVRYVL